MKFLKLRLVLPIFIVLLLGAGGVVLSSGKPEAQNSDEKLEIPSPAPINVKIEKVESSSMVQNISLTGQTKPDKEVKVSSEISGKIEYLPVDLGQKVKKGRTLARIDYQMVKAQADQAQAQYDLAKKTFDRKESLIIKDMISTQHVDEARAQMLAADAQLRIANANLKKSVIRASIDGVITSKYVEKGEFVSPGSPIVEIVNTDLIVIEAQVPEHQVSHVQPGCDVVVAIDALARDYAGKVDMVIPKADPVSGTFAVRVKINNPNNEIYAGMSARMMISAGKLENVIVVPQDIVIEENDNRSVFVEKDGIALRRDVLLGAINGDQVVIEGVSAGENLIVLGHRSLLDGVPVIVATD